MQLEDLQNFLFDDFGLCGCGNPDTAIDLLRDILNAIDSDCSRAKIEDMLGFDNNEGLYYTYLYWLDNIGLTGHGTSICSCWLTDNGKEIKDALNLYSDNEIMN